MKTSPLATLFVRNRLIIALACAATAGAAALAWSADSKPPIEKARGPEPRIPLDESAPPRDSVPRGSYANVVKKVAPAVVKIETTTTVKNNGREFPGLNDPFWHWFFGNRGQMLPQTPEFREHGLGSGVIVTKDGYILTNNHVVDGSDEVKVTLQDGRVFTAKVKGRDSKSDIAVVKIEANDLPTVPLADSAKVEVGDVVLAVGNPFGVGQTVTSGIVSATGRGNIGIEDFEDFIQTDAAINPGNSGGALVDIEGRLIGINTAIMSRSGGSQGVGFAVPSDLARSVMESLVAYGHVTRGYMGVMIQNVTPALAEQFGLKDREGALVGDVVDQGPAEKAGLKNGDVILEFDGKKMPDSHKLQLAVAETKPGSTVPVEILRDGKTETLRVTIQQQGGGEEQMASKNPEDKDDIGTLNGVGVSDLSQDERDQYNIPKEVKGAVITQVDPASASADAGLQPGDVIEEINHQPVRNADDAIRLTEKPKSRQTLLRVWDKGGSHYVVVDESNSNKSQS